MVTVKSYADERLKKMTKRYKKVAERYKKNGIGIHPNLLKKW
jgi:hypothetical protein